MLKAGGVAPGAIGNGDHGGMLQPFFSHTGGTAGVSECSSGTFREHNLVESVFCGYASTLRRTYGAPNPMSSFNPRIFTNPDRLKHIAPKRLKTFLRPWQTYFAARGLDLAAACTDDMPIDEIADILLNPDASVPEEMVDALYYVHETATNDDMEELLERAEAAGIPIDTDHEVTTADVSVQIWLAQPMLLQRHHAETIAFKRSNFMYFAGTRPKKAPAELPVLSDADVKTMQDRMDNWFEKKRRGRSCKIFAFPRGDKIWLLVRHGMPMRREGKHQEDGEAGIAFYRPQQHDVLIYDRIHDEMGVNASTKGERELYLNTFGEVLFGDEDYFDLSDRYTLDPLRELGPEALAHEDIDGLAGVRLVEFGRRWPGKVSELEIRKSDNLFKGYGEDWKKRLEGGHLTHATFKFAFDGSKRERSVTIRPVNIARYERDEDEQIIEAWLQARGFWPISDEDDENEDYEVLEDAG